MELPAFIFGVGIGFLVAAVLTAVWLRLTPRPKLGLDLDHEMEIRR